MFVADWVDINAQCEEESINNLNRGHNKHQKPMAE